MVINAADQRLYSTHESTEFTGYIAFLEVICV